MFGDYMNAEAEPEDRVYDEVKSLDDMYVVVEQCLDEYNNTHKNRMPLVIFRYVSLYIADLVRDQIIEVYPSGSMNSLSSVQLCPFNMLLLIYIPIPVKNEFSACMCAAAVHNDIHCGYVPSTCSLKFPLQVCVRAPVSYLSRPSVSRG